MLGEVTAAQSGSFTAVPEEGPHGLLVKLRGNCDSDAVPVLKHFLKALDAAVVAGGVSVVTVECDQLYFMNSGALKTIATWLAGVRTLPAEQRYRVVVRTNRSLMWQARSFDSIRRTVPEILTQVVG
jgi:hypothetical protein